MQLSRVRIDLSSQFQVMVHQREVKAGTSASHTHGQKQKGPNAGMLACLAVFSMVPPSLYSSRPPSPGNGIVHCGLGLPIIDLRQFPTNMPKVYANIDNLLIKTLFAGDPR